MTADLRQTLQSRLGREALAVEVHKGPSLTYAGLAAQVAALQVQMVARGTTVLGVLATRAPEAYVAVLAAYFLGIRFVPMNPELPVARLRRIAAISGADLIVHAGQTAGLAAELAAELAAGWEGPCLQLDAAATPEPAQLRVQSPAVTDIAYQMFTSGSTGDPKGVPVSYGNLDHYVRHMAALMAAPQGARFSQLFDLSFDLSLHDIFVALYSGGTLCPASAMDLMMPHRYLARNRIDYWFSVPMLAGQVIRGQAGKPAEHLLRMGLFCGEPLPTDYAAGFRAVLRDDAPLYNLYGPTEATIAITTRAFEPDLAAFSTVPLGVPFGDSVIGIETEDGAFSPITEGAEGELLLGGPQIFDGYQPPTDGSPFVTHDGTRFYRSGDLVRVAAGELLHMGRNDQQIKLRGYRIELSDVEIAFRRVTGCAAAAAVLLGEGDGREIALAYVAGADLDGPAALAGALPKYMQPARYLRLDALPVNINGKVDRKALRAMDWPA